MDIPCKFRENECPKYTKCDWYFERNIGVSKCRSVFYCKNKNLCSFSRTINDGKFWNSYRRIKRAEISKNVMKYGLENGEICWKDDNCFYNYCILDKAFIGFCKLPSDSDSAYILLYIFYGIPLSIIGFCFSICCKPFSKFIFIFSILLFLICCRAINSV